MDLFNRIAEHRAEGERLAWSRTIRDYIELLRERPQLAGTSHARVYDMIVSAGVEEKEGNKKYLFFADELFGLDRTLERLVEEYFHSAARRLDVRKRILLLMGPVSGGKSTIVTLLKNGLERYSRVDQGAVYAIRGCPMHEEQLHLVPDELRPEFEQQLNVRIEGSLCPTCRLLLETEFAGNIEDVPV